MVTRDEAGKNVRVEYVQKSFLLVIYPTGFGKSKAALDAVAAGLPFGRSKGLIVCHSEAARDDIWPKEISKWQSGLMQDARRICYASLHTVVGYDFDWVIFDEAHYINEERAKFFQNNRVRRCLFLTATLHDHEDRSNLVRKLARNNVIEIGLSTAIKDKVLNSYLIRVWEISMSPSEWEMYINICKKIDKMMYAGLKEAHQAAIGERMHFIYNLESKYKAAIYLRDQIRETGKRNLIFTQSQQMADKLSPYRYHSGTDHRDYQRFLNKEINELVTIKQIQEGANIPDLQSALAVQLNSMSYALVQKLGRLLRLSVDQVGRFHVIMVRNSIDETWVKSGLRNLDQNLIRYHQLDRDLYDK